MPASSVRFMSKLSAAGFPGWCRWWVALVCLVCPCCPAADAPAAGPYQVIIDRNPFGLNPAAPPPDIPAPKVAERPALRLTGIAKLDGQRMVYLVREERGQPPEYLNLAEGGSQGAVQVRAVDERTGAVRLLVDGTEWVLSFPEQAADALALRQAETQFVDEHTRAHEELQRREQRRLEAEAREQLQPNPPS